MSVTRNKNEWPIERIRTLTREHVRSLRENCLGRNPEIVAGCDQVLADGSYALDPLDKKKATGTGSRIKRERKDGLPMKVTFAPDAVDRVAKLLLDLPLADTVPNGFARRKLQEAPVETLGDLWRLFVVCGFSSRENSEDDGKLALFLHDDGPLLDLEEIGAEDCKPEWVLSQIQGRGLRFTKNKVDLVVGNFAHFKVAGKADDRLAGLCCERSTQAILRPRAWNGGRSGSWQVRSVQRATQSRTVHRDWPQAVEKYPRECRLGAQCSSVRLPLDGVP